MTELKTARRSIRRLNLIGLTTLVVLVGGIGGWAATTEISGAVVAAGQVVVESDVKTVQHPTGGIVGELLVREGDAVEAGQVVVRLDGTVVRSERGIITGRLDELMAHRSLLEAERDDRDAPQLPADLVAQQADAAVAAILYATRTSFDLRRTARLGQEAQLREQVIQLGEEVSGLIGQSAAKRTEIDLVANQLESFRDLLQREMIERAQVVALERDAARLEGELGQLTAAIATARGRISELEIQILRVGQEVRSAAAAELQEVNANIAELEERRVAAEDQLRRLDIQAPQAGVVHQLAIHTVGGVVGPGDPIMQIVPVADELIVEVRVAPPDRDQLSIGQIAALQFSAFNQRMIPRLSGEISRISANTLMDERTGATYYLVRITLAAAEIQLLGDVEVVPGMLVNAFIETQPQTVASYLLRPFADQLSMAFRER